jgi:hypothetical protein
VPLSVSNRPLYNPLGDLTPPQAVSTPLGENGPRTFVGVYTPRARNRYGIAGDPRGVSAVLLGHQSAVRGRIARARSAL